MACSPAVAEAVATARFSGGSVGDQDEEGLVRRQVAEEVVRKADQLQCGIRTHTSLDRRQLQSFVWSLADRLQRIIKPALSAVRAHVWDCCRKILDTFCDFEPFCVGLLPGCLHEIALQRRHRFATVEVAIALQRICRFATRNDELSASRSLSDALRQRQDSERRLFLEVAAAEAMPHSTEARRTARLCGVYAAHGERCRHSSWWYRRASRVGRPLHLSKLGCCGGGKAHSEVMRSLCGIRRALPPFDVRGYCGGHAAERGT